MPNTYLQGEDPQVAINKACHDYFCFHQLTFEKNIVNKDTAEVYYKPAMFHSLSPAEKRKLIEGGHPDLVLIPESDTTSINIILGEEDHE